MTPKNPASVGPAPATPPGTPPAAAAAAPATAPSAALDDADYWWFVARNALFDEYFGDVVPQGATILDVGSSNSPSVKWLEARGSYTPMDLDARGLPPHGVVGSFLEIPFDPDHFDIVSAFDVIEHIPDPHKAMQEALRVLKPGGAFLISVPAYEWAWSANDVHNDHFRRYTRKRIVRDLEREGFDVQKSTYAFCGAFAPFALNILRAKWTERKKPPVPLGEGEVPEMQPVGPAVERVLHGLVKLDLQALRRGVNLPFGSSILIAARKPL